MKIILKGKNAFFPPLASLTVSIVFMLLLSYLFVVTASDNLKLNAAIMKLTAKQRSLSQQIVNSIAADNLGGNISGAPLENLVSSFNILQHALYYGDNNIKVAGLRKDLALAYKHVNNGYTFFLQQLDINISNDNTKAFLSLLNAENFYLQQLDAFNNELTGYSNNQIKNFQFKEIAILIITLLFILLQVQFIFLPAIKKIERQTNVLNEISFAQSHVVRRPLTNIQSILCLILDSKIEDAYIAHLVTLVQSEADVLDSIIKNNVYKSNEEVSMSKVLN